MNLTQFKDGDLELVIDIATGAVFASQRGLARMVGVEPSTISRWAGVARIATKLAQIQTGQGIQGVALFDENAIYEAFAKYKPALLIQCAKAGLRLYLHHLAGYKFVPVVDVPNWQAAINAVQEKLYRYDSQRIAARSALKTDHKQLMADVLNWMEDIKRRGTTTGMEYKIYPRICDEMNVAITGESAKQMRDRLGAKKHKLLRDYMPPTPLEYYARTICICRNLIVVKHIYPLTAVLDAIALALPVDYVPAPIEFEISLEMAQQRADTYKKGQLLLPWAID